MESTWTEKVSGHQTAGQDYLESPALPRVGILCFRDYSCCPMSFGESRIYLLYFFDMPVPWVSDATADALEAVGEISGSPLGTLLSAERSALVN